MSAVPSFTRRRRRSIGDYDTAVDAIGRDLGVQAVRADEFKYARRRRDLNLLEIATNRSEKSQIYLGFLARF